MKSLFRIAIVSFLVSGCGQAPPVLSGGKPVSSWVQALKSPDPTLRRTAVFKLGNVGPTDPAALPAVLGALKDRDARVRGEAILALMKFGPAAQEAQAELKELQHDPDSRVRSYAAQALQKLVQKKGSSG